MSKFTWSKFSDDDKEALRSLRATFVMAPRKMSEDRFRHIIKENLAKGNVICGISEEKYVVGFDGQPQFEMLGTEFAEDLSDKIRKAHLPHRMHVLVYSQEEIDEVIRAVRPNDVVVVRGSYTHPFHRRSTYGLLQKRSIPFKYESPFSSETEAKLYLKEISPKLPVVEESVQGDETMMLLAANKIAKRSFDYSFQVGAVLAKDKGDLYELVDASANEVVPYQTYAMHHGNSREDTLSGYQDANYYDTIHAEMNLLVRSLERGYGLKDLTLFINMMPCPNCARTLCRTGLREVVYREVHSGGYAVELFKKSGINTRKMES